MPMRLVELLENLLDDSLVVMLVALLDLLTEVMLVGWLGFS
jgi:hypothetical protein